MVRDYSETSFADAIEAALHYVLLEHVHEVKERDRESSTKGGTVMLSTHDIYQKNRRLVRDIVEGRVDPEEYLDSLE